ncbi:MAG TPA: choice-of-anchor V domain-containing protein [Bryobacteraceae bacterium]|nr:choice-of-anchor V domain-containing protein [Bryobacteraceae bacterium]
MKRALLFTLLAAAPAALLAESNTPSLGYAGAPTYLPSDHNGQDCSTCHSSLGPANSDTSGSLTVAVSDYIPGVQQTIHIVLQHPQATRFGFQMTIRQVSDPTQSAGDFSQVSPADPVQVVCDDGSTYGSAPPCVTQRQFAEHKSPPFVAAGAGFTFNVAWNPPDPEVGKLQVYVAAVAANGDGTPAGDAVYTSVMTISNAGACALHERPLLESVVNGGSMQEAFSPESVVAVRGLAFNPAGPTRSAGPGDFVNGAYPTQLACISVQVSGPGFANPVLLPIVSVRRDQIIAQMPAFSATGPVMLQVLANPGAGNEIDSAPATLNGLQPFAPAFVILPNSTAILAEFFNTVTVVGNPAVIPGSVPAKPGDVVSLFGTGFGDTNPSVPVGGLGTGVEKLVNGVTITIGGITLDPSAVSYAGLAPYAISGLYRFDVRIPQGTASGDVPVTISIGGVQSPQPATIAIQ